MDGIIRKLGRQARQKQVDALPKVPLQQIHVQNCQLLLDRQELVSRLDKKGVMVELGVNRGEFSSMLLEMAQPAKLHLVDVWDSGRYHSGLYEEVRSRFSQEIESGKVEIHRKLSVDAAADFPGSYFDFVYIDTDHTYETTRNELMQYQDKVKPGGLIAGHDYSMGNWVKSFRYGVVEAVHEFCVGHRWELVYLTCEPLEGQSFAIRKIPD